MKIKELLGEDLVTLAEYYTGDQKRLIAVCKTLDLDVLRKQLLVSFGSFEFSSPENINNPDTRIKINGGIPIK